MTEAQATGPNLNTYEEVINIQGTASPGLTQPTVTTKRPEISNFTAHIEKLTGENFGIWKFQMSVMFRVRKMLSIVDGSFIQEASDNPEDWEDKDTACQSMILSPIDPKLMRRLRTCMTANQMWRRLCTMYELNATENVQLLQQKFCEMKMKSGTEVMDHISSVEELANQLNDLGESVLEQAIVCKIMCSLPPSSRHMVSALDNVPHSMQTIEALTFRLLREESRNRVQGETEEESEKAFYTSRGQRLGANQKAMTLLKRNN